MKTCTRTHLYIYIIFIFTEYMHTCARKGISSRYVQLNVRLISSFIYKRVIIYLSYCSQEDERRSERSHRPEVENFEEGSDEGEYTDADDFIVDDDGRPIAEKRKKKKPIFSDA